MSPPRQSSANALRQAEAGFEQPERRKQELSEAARDLKAAERVQAAKTAKLKALRLQKEEAERLALEAAPKPVKKTPSRAKKKPEKPVVRWGTGSA